jgi:hypothetical protein
MLLLCSSVRSRVVSGTSCRRCIDLLPHAGMTSALWPLITHLWLIACSTAADATIPEHKHDVTVQGTLRHARIYIPAPACVNNHNACICES